MMGVNMVVGHRYDGSEYGSRPTDMMGVNMVVGLQI